MNTKEYKQQLVLNLHNIDLQIAELQLKRAEINKDLKSLPVDYEKYIGKVYCQEGEFKRYFYVKEYNTNDFTCLTMYENNVEVCVDYMFLDFFDREDITEIPKVDFDALTIDICNQILALADISKTVTPNTDLIKRVEELFAECTRS